MSRSMVPTWPPPQLRLSTYVDLAIFKPLSLSLFESLSRLTAVSAVEGASSKPRCGLESVRRTEYTYW